MSRPSLADAAPEPMDVVIWDLENPRSVINLLPTEVHASFLRAMNANPEIVGLDEHRLKKYLKSRDYITSPVENSLRMSFWMEYDRAQLYGDKMSPGRICANICTRVTFYNHFLNNAESILWILCPPGNYLMFCKEALAFGLGQLREVLEVPHVDGKGKVNVKLMELKAKITFLLDQRINGSVVQKIEQKSVNLQIGMSDQAVAGVVAQNTMEQLETRLKELEARDRSSKKMIERSQRPEIVIESTDPPDPSSNL